jgi:hypothetical protein
VDSKGVDMGDIVVLDDVRSKALQHKFKVLEYDIDTQVEMLNSFYGGNVTFKKTADNKVEVSNIKYNVTEFEFPELSNYSSRLNSYDIHYMKRIRLPKNVKAFPVHGMEWIRFTEAIEIYDGTELNLVGYKPTASARLKKIAVIKDNGEVGYEIGEGYLVKKY